VRGGDCCDRLKNPDPARNGPDNKREACSDLAVDGFRNMPIPFWLGASCAVVVMVEDKVSVTVSLSSERGVK